MNKPCKRHRECCSYSCGVRKRCQRTDNCLPDGKPCKGTGNGNRPNPNPPTGKTGAGSSPTECCSRNCANGKCEPKDDDCIVSAIPPSTAPQARNETCKIKSDCCSNYCSKTGTDTRQGGRGVCRNKDFAKCNNTGTCTNRNAKTVCCSKICEKRKCKPTAEGCGGLTSQCKVGTPRGKDGACCSPLTCDGGTRKCVDPEEETTEESACLGKGKSCTGENRKNCCGGESQCVEGTCQKDQDEDDEEDACTRNSECRNPARPICRNRKCVPDGEDGESTTESGCRSLRQRCKRGVTGKRRCCAGLICERGKCAKQDTTTNPETCSPKWGRCTKKADCCGVLLCKAQKCNDKNCKPKNRPCLSPTECCSNRCIKKGRGKKCGV